MSSCNFGTSANCARDPIVDVILRLNEIEDDGIAIVNAGNASEVIGCGLEVAIGVGGVRVILCNSSSRYSEIIAGDIRMRRTVPEK